MSVVWPYARLRTYAGTQIKASDLNTIQDAIVDQNIIPLRLVDDFLDNTGGVPPTSRYANNSGAGDLATIESDSGSFGGFGVLHMNSDVGGGGSIYVKTLAGTGIGTRDFVLKFRFRKSILDSTSRVFLGIANGNTPDSTYRGFQLYTDMTKWAPLVSGVAFTPLAAAAPTSNYQILEMNRISGQLNFLVNDLHICTVADATDFSALKFTFTTLHADYFVDWYGFGF